MGQRFSSAWRPVIRGVLLTLGITAIVVVLMLWLIGTFHPKIGANALNVMGEPLNDRPVEVVANVRLPVFETSVGTVRPVHQVDLASKLLAKVARIDLRAGDAVKAGQVIVRLDDNDLKARKDQALAAVAAARAARDQAQIELDRVNAQLLSAQAEFERAQWQLNEAQTVLSYATIVSPLDGVVVDKRVEAGDIVVPGQVLAQLYDPKRMQLVASVRESLTHQLRIGQSVPVEIDALNIKCHGTVSEIVPEAESASRSFLVKVTGPCPPGVYPNMFGRLFIPLGEEQVLVVPESAVRQVGQLSLVKVVEGNNLQRRSIQLGRQVDRGWEILSGLRAGERVAVARPGSTSPIGTHPSRTMPENYTPSTATCPAPTTGRGG
jgi:RND family efflux transporter MFP subunit